MEIEKYISVIDTERFGFKIAKVNDFENQPKVILNFLKNNNVKLVLTKIPLENLALINELEQLNFQIKDIQATYKFDLINLKTNEIGKTEGLIIRDANPNDIPELKKIATESFNNYGHYAADNKLDVKKSNEIYSDWIARSCEDCNVADKVLVAEYNGKIAGFLTFKIYSKDSLRYAAGGIGAVSKMYRNINLFKVLIFEGLLWGKEIGLDWEEHNVLINNYPVNKSFTKSNFYIYKTFVTMHHWIE